jgi:hypothetical protein
MAPSTNTTPGPRTVRSTALAVPSFDRILYIASVLLDPNDERAMPESTRSGGSFLA